MHGCIFSDYSSVWICAREWDCWPSVCSFLRALHSVLHSGCTSLLPTSSGRGLLPPHPLQRLSFVDLFLAVLSLRSCPPAFLPLQGAGSTLQGHCAAFTLQGLSSCRERGLGHVAFSGCGPRASLPQGLWDLLGAEMGPVSPRWQASSSPLSHPRSP